MYQLTKTAEKREDISSQRCSTYDDERLYVITQLELQERRGGKRRGRTVYLYLTR